MSRKPALCSPILLTAIVLLSGCISSAPDKTLAGAALGAGWGAGAGAVVGNQVNHPGSGTAIGAGFGAVNGMLVGMQADLLEDAQIEQEKQLASMRIQNQATANELGRLQRTLDQAVSSAGSLAIYQVFFDVDATSLRSGAIADLETIAESLKRNPQAYAINVIGHTDDAGAPDYNERLAEARARTVASYLQARGISVDQVKVESFGAKRPIASNTTDTGRQLNRRVDVYIAR